VKEHEIDIAERVEFSAAIAADGDKRHSRERFRAKRRIGILHRFHDGAEQEIENRGAGLANFSPAAACSMNDLQTMRFDLEEVFVAAEFILRPGAWGNRQPGRSTAFDSFEQRRH
jgi:hypothetical protein